MKLDTTSLGNAVLRLRDGLARSDREPADEQIRDGLIQRFEFTYELTHKMLRRVSQGDRGFARRHRADALCRFDPDWKCSGLAAERLAGLATVSRNARPHEPYLRCQCGITGRLGDPGVS